MSFLSFEWLAWMVATLSLYWLFPERQRNLVLILITAAFIFVHSPVSLAILCVFSLVTYLGTRVVEVSDLRVTIISLLIVSVLAFFKVTVHLGESFVGETLIPIGLSYYSFRCFHYVFERYRNTIEPPSFQQYLGYMFFLPTLVVGPINRARPFFDDYVQKTWDAGMISYGLERILYGYAKVTILSGFVVNGLLRDWQDSIDPESHEVFITYLGVVIDGLDIYFLFSGYSDIAIGFARLLGYRVMENFSWPYFKKNISEFWRAWHISLSSWCRDYVYLFVVGHTRNPYLGTLATFVVIGLWHEISLRYILWGLWHGVGILLWRQFFTFRRRLALPEIKSRVVRAGIDAASVLLTVHYVWFGLVIVSRDSLAESLDVYRVLLLGWLS